MTAETPDNGARVDAPVDPGPGSEPVLGELVDSAILVVDGSSSSRNQIRTAFLRAGFADVRVVADGAQALAEVTTCRPDLVIVDLHMSTMDGYEVCRRLRAAPPTARLPVLVLSTLDQPADVDAIFAAGASDLLRRPVQLPELLARARSHLERWRFENRLVAYRSRIAHELAAARRLQSNIVPSSDELHAVAEATGLMIHGMVEPSAEIGGDIWGIHRIDSRRVSVYAADITGHGIVSAINAFRVHTLLQTGGFDFSDPAAALAAINVKLCRTLETGEFATFIVGTLDLDRDEFVYATAGAPPPIVGDLVRPTARVCDARGLPLGLTPTASYENRRTALKPGEFLLIYSDALTDLRLENGSGMGWDRLSEIVAGIPRGSRPAAAFDRIWDRLCAGVPRPLSDDLTIALFGRPPRQETLR
jgi:sigma-B regulation protein RsbU (phosphoserine phosphatase)